MPKVEIDYSNTIFYKIFCKDTTIKELYVGLTTNFVQRKHGHKQSCKNEKAPNHNCKLYNAIRNAGGWENWEMEIIAFHNCKDSHEAHKKEQEYFETLGATLNSIEPLPKPKIKVPIVKIVKEKTILFCKPCNIHFSYWKAQEAHNNSNKHHKMVDMNNTTFFSQETPIKFYCEKCDYKCRNKGDFNKHIQSKKHTTKNLTNEKSPKNVKKYACETCDYNTSKQFDYLKHLSTLKHKNQVLGDISCEKVASAYECNCGKKYNHASSLWNHKQKCPQLCTTIETPTPKQHQDDDTSQTNLILELVKQNQEFKQLLIEQNKTILEVAKNSQVNNTINNTNTNSHNKTFNLQFFLNETCKDAMNMKDFIKSLELSLPELEKMGELGFAEGMSRVFVNRLNSLDITKRPIHCSDVKREIIHIKDDNKWEMDSNLDRLRKIIKQLTIKNILKVDDWKKANQGCTEYNSRKNAQYLRINMEAIGPVDDAEVKRDFGKIIRRVAETTAIDKKYLMA